MFFQEIATNVMFTVYHGSVQEFPPLCNERQIETAILNMLARADLAIAQCLPDDFADLYILGAVHKGRPHIFPYF